MKTKNTLVRSENFVERQLGEETVLVPISQTGVDVQSIYTMNKTSAIVWQLLENECTKEEIVVAIEAKYTADKGVIRKDVESLLSEFIHESFVLVVEN